MCLLVVFSRVFPLAPLVVAANRDEILARPAVSMTTLRDANPRILGGRDDLSGGTWLAINEHGVVSGLTNRQLRHGFDPTRRSRGELPIRLAQHRSAREAVEVLRREVRPLDYNAAWILVGDRRSLFHVDLTDGDTPSVEELAPGCWILENRPLHADSPKADAVRARLVGIEALPAEARTDALRRVLSSHEIPSRHANDDGDRPPQTQAACVHGEVYGTRSATLVTVHDDGLPTVLFADGRPCEHAFVAATF